MEREELFELLDFFKRAKNIQDLFYDRCYSAVYDQKLGDRIAYDDIFNALFHVKNLINMLSNDIDRFESTINYDPSCVSALNSLTLYLNQLSDCQERLRMITSRLHEKTDGSFFSYPLFRYTKDTANLNRSMHILESKGNELQSNYEAMLTSLANN